MVKTWIHSNKECHFLLRTRDKNQNNPTKSNSDITARAQNPDQIVTSRKMSPSGEPTDEPTGVGPNVSLQ